MSHECKVHVVFNTSTPLEFYISTSADRFPVKLTPAIGNVDVVCDYCYLVCSNVWKFQGSSAGILFLNWKPSSYIGELMRKKIVSHDEYDAQKSK